MSFPSRPLPFTTVTPAHISKPGPQSNTPHAFKVALDKHLEKLKPSEKLAFNEAYNSLTTDGLLASVRAFDKKHCSTSYIQRCSPAITKCFMVLNELLRSTTIWIQSSPEISSLVVGGIRLLVDIAVKYVTFFPKLTAMISQLSQYLEVLQSYVDRLDRESEKDAHLIQHCAINLYGDWLDFCTKARSVFVDKKGVHRRWASIRIFLRVQWDPFEASLGQIQTNFQQNLDLLLHSTQATQFNDIRSGLAQIQSARSDQETKEAASTRKDFMHWISVLDFDDDHERISSRKHPGTGNWLIQRLDFQSWMNGSSSRLLWCYGKPGSGKSVLASHVLEHITTKAVFDSRVGIAFCYFNYKQADKQKPRQILSAFIKQLCYDRHVLPPRLLDFYQKHLLDARTPSFDAVRGALAALADEFSEIYFVIDALDECEQDIREKIIEAVVEISHEHRCIKAFVASRLESDIENLFRSLQTSTVCIQAENTAADIRKYVDDSVQTLIASNKLRIQDGQTRPKIIQTLVQKADGMFLWVFLQLQSLCRQRSDRDILHELNNLPSDLYETYRRILGVIEELPLTLQSLAQRSLTLVFYAARPLRMAELIDLAAIAAGFDQMKRLDMNRYSAADILEACANLLSEDEGVVRPSHFSVQEYFSSPRTITENPRLSKYFVSPSEGHPQIVTACLRYLSLGFLRGGVCATELSLDVRLNQYPCARYAAQYFDYHLSMLNRIPEDIRTRLEAFLSQPERSIASTLQLRRLLRGSHSGLLRGDFDDVQWPANAGTLIESTGLSSIQDIRSENACWHEELLPHALHQACYDGSPNVAKRLIDSGWDPTKEDQRGNTPLFYAARGGHAEVCRVLLGPQVYADSLSYRNALRMALELNHESVIRVLLLGSSSHGTKCSKELFQYSWAVLAFGGYEHMLRRLLESTTISAGADYTIFSTLVQAASYEPHLEIVHLLFEKCFMKTSTPKFGSALHICCEYGHFELAQLLLDHGAIVNAHRTLEGVDLPNDVSKGPISDYYHPLQIAIAAKNFGLVKLLLENGADVIGGSLLKDEAPLSVAATDGSIDLVELLLDNGANLFNLSRDYWIELAKECLRGKREKESQVARKELEAIQEIWEPVRLKRSKLQNTS